MEINQFYPKKMASFKWILTIAFSGFLMIQQASGQVISLSAVTTDPICHNGTGGAIDLTVSGGVAPYN